MTPAANDLLDTYPDGNLILLLPLQPKVPVF